MSRSFKGDYIQLLPLTVLRCQAINLDAEKYKTRFIGLDYSPSRVTNESDSELVRFGSYFLPFLLFILVSICMTFFCKKLFD